MSSNCSSSEKKVLVLISVGVFDRVQADNQTKTLNLLQAKLIPFETVNGMDPNQRERRNALFQISGIRANYPQLFFVLPSNETIYFGNFEKLEGLNEMTSLPEDVIANALRHNPDLETWDSTFGSVVSSFS